LTENRKVRIKSWVYQSWKGLTFPFLLFLGLPLLALLLRVNLDGIWQNLQLVQVRQAIQLSMVTSFWSVALTIIFCTPVAYYLSHRHYRFHRLVDTLVDLPIVLPPAVAGVGLLLAFGRRGILGSELDLLGINIPFTPVAVVIAQMFIASPYYIKASALGFMNVDCELRQAAALDGATRWQIFRHIILPISWVSVLSGCLLTWARAMGEFGATLIFAGNFPGRTQTMPLAIYIGFEIDLEIALTLSIILVGFSFLTLIVVKGFLHRRIDFTTHNERNLIGW